MKRLAFLAFFLATTAQAAELPAPCGPDPRERCIAYKAGQIVRVYLAPGATVTIELPPTETVFFVGASDNGIISGTGATERAAAGQDATSDPNLMTAVPGGADNPTQFLTIKALRHLEPQPFLVIGRWSNPVTGKQEFRRHVFEILTRPGDLTQDTPDTMFSVRFTDPETEQLVRNAKWRAEKEKRDAQRAADRLQTISLSSIRRNTAYDGQATEADRAALAPSEMWDDGQRTYLRYPGNRRVPHAFQVLPDGKEGVIGQQTVPDPELRGNMLILQGVVPMMRLRDGDAVLCIANRAYDPVGRNPGTGTVDPGVSRLSRRND
ncbi:TrbG/VirB9 family P-type conjugative transfer protein (plasmid) [Skermanella rosea]|uniref:TrbG/VirB9 family P-type conjugative transfer protein n=1 Tax=Skermanella rosea TaxID=1817965 RepID=UPI001931BF42|nr:TrbG/VirB9 family P-type conjugative transfer protein [Skermanella rosea]UEM08130.1 TrbG/VirB9 family P-type conjugative transfer protein [Skermanella rosea]